jgi:pyruvate dehydrogenase (quinone)/pyruvate oxidase
MDFVKFAEVCGGHGVRIEDPSTCRDQLAEALAMDGPVLIEAVVDPYEPPMPAEVSPKQATHLAEALVRGEPNRKRVGVTLFRDVVHEADFAAAPAGVIGEAKDKLAGLIGRNGDQRDGNDNHGQRA